MERWEKCEKEEKMGNFIAWAGGGGETLLKIPLLFVYYIWLQQRM